MKQIILLPLVFYLFTSCSEAPSLENEQLINEKTALEEQLQIVETLKKQIETEQQRADNAIPLLIDNQQAQIGNLGALITQVREAQSDVSNMANEALTQERAENQNIQNQVNPQIQMLQQNIPRTEEQITLLTSIGLRSKEQETRLTELKNQLTEQRQQLDNLQKQLTASNVGSLTRSNQIYTTMQEQRRELAGYKDDIQTELDSKRESLATLQSYSLQSRMSLMTLNQQLRSAELNLKQQTEKVQELEKLTK